MAALVPLVSLCSKSSRTCSLTFLDHLHVQARPLFQSSSIFDIVPCLQLVGISSCLPLCFPFVCFSVDFCFFSQKLLVAAILHRCGWVLASSSGQTTLIVFRFPGRCQQVLCVPPSWCLRFWCGPSRAQDYKEKHKLDSKQISDSAFGAHLSFCHK